MKILKLQILQNEKIAGMLFLLFAAILAGLESVIAKPILENNNPLQVQFMSRCIAAILLLPLLFGQPIKRLTKKQIFNIVLLGFLWTGVVSPLFYIGLKLTTSLSATLIQYSYPFLVIILAYFFLKEKITVRKIIGTSLIVMGVFSVLFAGFSGGESSTMLGNLIVLAAMIIGAVWTILAKSFVKNISPEVLTASGLIVGLFAVAIYLKGIIIPIFTFQIFILGITIALFWFFYFKGLKYITATKAAAIESTAPFFTAIFTIFILIRLPGLYEIIAVFLIIQGLLFLAKEE